MLGGQKPVSTKTKNIMDTLRQNFGENRKFSPIFLTIDNHAIFFFKNQGGVLTISENPRGFLQFLKTQGGFLLQGVLASGGFLLE